MTNIAPLGSITALSANSTDTGNKGMAIRNLRLLNSVFEHESDTNGDMSFANFSLGKNLSDFASRYKIPCPSTCDKQGSFLTKKDCSKTFLQKLGLNKDAFTTKKAEKFLDKNNNKIHQSDLIKSEINANGGIYFLAEDDDYIQAAIKLASADIQAIERSSLVNSQYISSTKGELDYNDFFALHHGNGEHNKAIQTLNLDDNDETLTAEEYACYILATDGLAEFEKDDEGNILGINVKNPKDVDGVLVQQEAIKASEYTDEELQALAQAIYEYEDFAKYFNK